MGSLSVVRDSGHCSVNCALDGNKEFIDEAVFPVDRAGPCREGTDQ